MSDGPHTELERPQGIEGTELTGPFPVGQYATALKGRLQEFEHVQLFGEVWNLREGRAKFYFELRDSFGALPCSIWRTDWDKLELSAESLSDGAVVVVAGGCDYYPGSATSSPAFSFAVERLRVAGTGDLLAELDRLRKLFDSESLLEPQKQLVRSSLPKVIGVITGEHGKARDDLVAALKRRGWRGQLIWAFAPVQDRHAAPLITEALQGLAAQPSVETVVVARGGGSLADLFAFCDETLCRTVALLRVPVIASIGHHTDRTLLDDVAAVSCSTPTHAAEAVIPLDLTQVRELLKNAALTLSVRPRQLIAKRNHELSRLSRAPHTHIKRERLGLHKQLREIRASSRRRIDAEHKLLERNELVLAAHDPDRTLERGYVLVESHSAEPITSATAASKVGRLRLRFHDYTLNARLEPDE